MVDYDFQVTVIGAGCICSNLMPNLVRMGIEDLKVYDPDVIEEHNRKNQIYRIKDLGRKKVEALSEIIEEATGVKIDFEDRKVENEFLEGVVICGVDTMDARKTIWENCIKLQPQIDLFVDARVGGPMVRVYSLNPTDLQAISVYEQNLYDGSEVVDPTCNQGEIPTLAMVVSVVTNILKKFAQAESHQCETLVELDNLAVSYQ